MALREMLLKLGIEVDKQGEQKALTGLEKLRAAAKAAAVGMAALGAAKATLGIADEVRSIADEAAKMGARLGVSSQALQEFRFAADLAGASSSDVSSGFKNLQRSAFEASQGTKTFSDLYDRLGINVKGANGELKSADVLAMEVADSFQGMTDETEKSAIAQKLLGRAGLNLIPLLNQGSDAINKQRQEAQALGGVIGDDLTKESEALTDAQTKLDFAFLGLKVQLAEVLIPALESAVTTLVEFAVAIRGPVTRAITFFRRVASGIGDAIGFLDSKFEGLGTALAVVASGLTLLGGAFALFGKRAVLAAVKVGAAWVIANAPLLLMIALGALLVAAILIVIEDLVVMGEGGESVIGTLIKGFEKMVDEVGGWGAALKEIFFNTMNFWFGMSRETFDKILAALDATATAMLAPLKLFIDTAMNFFLSFVQFVTDVFSVGISKAFTNLWMNLGASVETFVNDALGSLKKIFDFANNLSGNLASLVGIEGIPSVTQTFSNVFGDAASGNPAGVSPGGALPPSTGGSSIVSSPSTTIDVSVDAPGNSNADDIGSRVAEQVEIVLDRKNRQQMQDFALAGVR